MKLHELTEGSVCSDVCDGEVIESDISDISDISDDTTIEEDLQQALDLLDKHLLLLEEMRVRRGRIVRIPEGMQELMEETADLLDRWEQLGK